MSGTEAAPPVGGAAAAAMVATGPGGRPTPGAARGATRRLTGRAGLTTAIVACLLGAVLTLFASAATWAHTTVVDAATAGAGTAVAAPLPVKLGGAALAPAVSAFGLLGLAAALALVATRGVARRVVGVLAAAAGVGVIVFATRVGFDPVPVVRASAKVTAMAPSGSPRIGAVRLTAGPWLALVGGLAFVLAGALTALFGTRWPGMGGRYQAPGQSKARRPFDAWEAIERGQDPTDRPEDQPSPPR